ncbi:MAG: hypothetical protein ACKVQV_09540 [Bacteroidia bacterium]
MKIAFNKTFQLLLDKFNLPADLNFQIELPLDIQKKLTDKIIFTGNDLGLAGGWTPKLANDPLQQSYQEDFANHFHVDMFVEDDDEKQVFEIGVKTLVELAKRFQKEKISNVQLSYSLMTPEKRKLLDKEHNIDDDEHIISDRLICHIKRPGQIVVNESLFNSEYEAILTIDL